MTESPDPGAMFWSLLGADEKPGSTHRPRAACGQGIVDARTSGVPDLLVASAPLWLSLSSHGRPLRDSGQVLIALGDLQQGRANLGISYLLSVSTRFLGPEPP